MDELKAPELTKEDQLALCSAARDNLIIFSILAQRDYDPNWHHEAIARKLEAVQMGEIKRLMIFMPPRHGKSELVSVKFPGWFIGKSPDKSIIATSYNSDLANGFGAQTLDLVGSQEYQAIFGKKLKEDAKSKGHWMIDGGRGHYYSIGIGGAITGRGADVLLIDDPLKNREEADSIVIRNAIWNWYTSTAYTRLEKDGAIILVMTRWHKDDLAGRILASGHSGKWDVLDLPAIAMRDEKYRRVGEPLWPAKYGVRTLQDIRETIGEMDWSSLYQQQPILAENQEFKSEYFKYFEESDLSGKELEYYTTVDLAISKKESADFVAIITVGKERNSHNWYLVDVEQGRLDPLQVIDKLFSLQAQYRPVKFGIETVAYQEALIYFLNEEMKKRQTYLAIQEIKHSQTSKETRIRGLVPMYKTGVIYHRRSYLGLESELLNFPKGAHDDTIDALAMQMEVIKPTKREERRPAVRQAVNYLTGRPMYINNDD